MPKCKNPLALPIYSHLLVSFLYLLIHRDTNYKQ